MLDLRSPTALLDFVNPTINPTIKGWAEMILTHAERPIQMTGQSNISIVMENKQEYPKCGIAVMVMKEGRVLLGKRKGAHGAGNFAFPGGKLE